MKLVVGYDGSDGGKRALDRAAMIAGSMATKDDQIVVVAAAEPRPHITIEAGPHLDPSEVRRRESDVDDAVRFFSERGLQAEGIQGQGDPGSVILAAAKDADMVIVGSRGLNTIERLLLGSVSSKVVHRAQCDVLVVR